jgi:hypothetical protein
MATGERSKHLPLVEQADGGGGSSNGDSASHKHLGAVERGFAVSQRVSLAREL